MDHISSLIHGAVDINLSGAYAEKQMQRSTIAASIFSTFAFYPAADNETEDLQIDNRDNELFTKLRAAAAYLLVCAAFSF